MALVLGVGVVTYRPEPARAQAEGPVHRTPPSEPGSERSGTTATDPSELPSATLSQSVSPPSERSWGELEGDLGGGAIGPDGILSVRAAFDLQEGGFTMGLDARLRLRIVVQGTERQGLGIRKEDWDEPSDLAYILRYAAYRRQVRGVHLGFALGELGAYRLGHGTLVRDYASAVDVDHPHGGFRMRIAGERFAVAGVLDDFVAPSFAALRVSGVPLLRGIHALLVGVSGLLDFNAPLDIARDAEGNRRVDGRRNLRARTGQVGGAGIDVAYRLGDPEDEHLLLYLDGNLLTTNLASDHVGLGLHLGARFRVHVVSDRLTLTGGLEYARLGPGYSPAWVDRLYDVQRLQLPLTRRARTALGDAAPTKATGLLVQDLAPAGNAWRAEAGLRLAPWVSVRAHLQTRPGIAGDSVGARLGLTLGPRLLAALLLERYGVLSEADLGRPDGLLVAAEARYRPHRNVYVLATYSRLFALDAAGIYGPIDQFNLAVGGAWGY